MSTAVCSLHNILLPVKKIGLPSLSSFEALVGNKWQIFCSAVGQCLQGQLQFRFQGQSSKYCGRREKMYITKLQTELIQS